MRKIEIRWWRIKRKVKINKKLEKEAKKIWKMSDRKKIIKNLRG